MKIRMLGMFCLILIVFGSVANAEKNIEMFYTGSRTAYTENKEFLRGGGFRTLLSSESYRIDFSMNFSAGNFQKIGENKRRFFRLEAEKQIKFFTFGVDCLILKEKERIYSFDAPENTMVSEAWQRKDFAGRVGFKIGEYRKSFLSLGGFCGYSDYNRKLNFCDFSTKNNWNSFIAGGNIRGSLRSPLGIKFLWIDFKSSYKYFVEINQHIAESTFGIGVRITRYIGIKVGGSAANKITEKRKGIKFKTYCIGLTLTI